MDEGVLDDVLQPVGMPDMSVDGMDGLGWGRRLVMVWASSCSLG